LDWLGFIRQIRDVSMGYSDSNQYFSPALPHPLAYAGRDLQHSMNSAFRNIVSEQSVFQVQQGAAVAASLKPVRSAR
jgi:hypothetical protein